MRKTINNKPSVSILLATFNGEKYIYEMLDSIKNQTYLDFVVYIRDDGSSDNTLNIIENYCRMDSRFILVHDDKGNVGVINNFQILIEHVDSEIYVLCDQDDVWCNNKIENVLSNYLNKTAGKRDIPWMMHGNAFVWKMDGPSELFHPISPVNEINAEYCDFFFDNRALGCTIAFNDVLRKIILPFPKIIYMHDWWIAVCAVILKCIEYDGGAMIYYRQHSSNVIGAYRQSKTLVHYIKLKMKDILICINQIDVALSRVRTFYCVDLYNADKMSVLSYLKALYIISPRSISKKIAFLSTIFLLLLNRKISLDYLRRIIRDFMRLQFKN